MRGRNGWMVEWIRDDDKTLQVYHVPEISPWSTLSVVGGSVQLVRRETASQSVSRTDRQEGWWWTRSLGLYHILGESAINKLDCFSSHPTGVSLPLPHWMASSWRTVKKNFPGQTKPKTTTTTCSSRWCLDRQNKNTNNNNCHEQSIRSCATHIHRRRRRPLGRVWWPSTTWVFYKWAAMENRFILYWGNGLIPSAAEPSSIVSCGQTNWQPLSHHFIRENPPSPASPSRRLVLLLAYLLCPMQWTCSSLLVTACVRPSSSSLQHNMTRTFVSSRRRRRRRY